jgi:hypothetical protein
MENTDLLLEYMRIVMRQQTGILEAVSSMQRQNDNLSAIIAQELIRRHGARQGARHGARDDLIQRIARPRSFFTPTVRQEHRRQPFDFGPFSSPVVVRPSAIQVRMATRTLLFRDISNNTQTICPIDRELLQPDDTVLQIIPCGHFFRDTNLRRHFRGNTRCPLCRYDIREYVSTDPFASRPNINPSTQTTSEIQSLSSTINNILNPV